MIALTERGTRQSICMCNSTGRNENLEYISRVVERTAILPSLLQGVECIPNFTSACARSQINTMASCCSCNSGETQLLKLRTGLFFS